MTDPVAQLPAAGSDIAVRQRAFLLDQLSHAPGAKLRKVDANRAIRAAVKKELHLDVPTVNRVRAEMVAEGLLATERQKRVEYFQLTDPGRAYLEQHRQDLPLFPQGGGRGIKPPSNEKVRDLRNSYLLLQLIKASDHTLRLADANRFDTLGRQHLELNAATARAIRHELAQQGLLTISGANRSEMYTLTAQGRLKLGTLTFYDDYEFKLRGRVLNDLLEAAREAARDFVPPPAETKQPVVVPPQTTAPDVAQLEACIFRTFEDLLRERHTVTGLVPIHEVREEVRKQLGETAARHDVFDHAVLACWQAGRLRLIPITDGSRASLEQLQASIPATGETMFFLESVHESVAR